MPYRVYLPPGYAEGTRHYASLYLLHGMGGSDREWQDLGIASASDRLIAAGQIAPLIIVVPEGAGSYWVDQASGGEQWGHYTAVDLVNEIDATYRTIARTRSRAIGGLSMGAHGALTDLGVRHEWHLWAGDHSGTYWSAHLDDYLRFYNASLSSRAARSTLS